MKKKIKIENLSILGYYGSANTGDEAILACLLQGLSEIFPDFKISVFSSDSAHTQKHHNVDSVQSSLPNRFSDLVLRSLGRNRKNFYKALSTFIKADILLVGGGGLFHDTPYSNKHFLNMLRTISWAKKLGARVAVLSVTVGPLHLETSRKHLRTVFDQVDLITVREEQSKALLSEIGLSHPRLFVTGDMVYLLKPSSEERILDIARNERLKLDSSPRIAVCLCAYEETHPGRIRSIANFCDFAVSRLGAQVWFIPMQTSRDHDDRDQATAVMSMVKHPDSMRCIKGSYSPPEILGLIGQTHAVLAERLHGSIMAVNANVPCFGIGYSPKVTWFFDKIGYPHHHIPSKDLSAYRLVSDFSEFWERREQIRHELKAKSFELKSAALENFHHFKRNLVNEYARNA